MDEISKLYSYNTLYEKYFKNMPGYENVDSNVDHVIKVIYKKFMIGNFGVNGDLEIRMKKIKTSKRESSVIYEAEPMNVVKEDLKSSHNLESQKDKIGEVLISVNNQIKNSRTMHQRHSSKTTKKFELSLVSLGKSNEAATIVRLFKLIAI